MARRTFPEGFKEKAIAYPAEHPELSMKRCAEELGIGYSTLRRWLDEAAEETQNAAPAEEPVAAEAVEEKVLAFEADAPAIAEDAAAESEASVKMASVDEALADAAAVVEDLLGEMKPVVFAGDAPMPEAGFVIEDEAVAADEAEDEAEASVDDEVETAPTVAPEATEETIAVVAEEEGPVEETAAPADEDEEPSLEASAPEKDEIDDDPLFASIGSVMSGSAVPHDEDYAFRCKSHPSSYKDVQHMAGDVFVSVTAQIGNVIEGVTDGMSGVAERLNLYKKRHDLKKEQKLLKKEKEKRLKR